jgi:hypothetical protein
LEQVKRDSIDTNFALPWEYELSFRDFRADRFNVIFMERERTVKEFYALIAVFFKKNFYIALAEQNEQLMGQPRELIIDAAGMLTKSRSRLYF